VENHDDDVLVNDIDDDKGSVEESYSHDNDESIHGNSKVKMMKITAMTMITTMIMTTILKRKKRKTMMDS
jgi:hypothetical protein